MGKIPQLRPKVIRPPTRGNKATYFQMHIYDQESKRLESERSEILKRLSLIEERLKVIKGELHILEQRPK
ncbi:MAG: hypothetical protein ACYDEJ_02215 [Desulfitobacteriaceae bacterium]